MTFINRISFLPFCLFAFTQLQAATFCVSSAVSLQDSLDIAAASGTDDTIQMVSGEYPGVFSYHSSTGNNLVLEGGYGDACVFSNFDETLTVLDAEANGTTLTLVHTQGGHFQLKGFTVKNGKNTDLELSETKGNGGGIYASTLGDLLVDSLLFSNNQANISGGGLYFKGSAAVINSQFVNNTALVSGGGLYLNTAESLSNPLFGNVNTISDNTFSANSAGSGGGLYARNAKLEHNQFDSNIALVTGSSLFGESLDIINNKMMNSPSAVPAITHIAGANNQFVSGNLVTRNTGYGLSLSDVSDHVAIYFVNNLFFGNVGGVLSEHKDGRLSFTNNVFLNNGASPDIFVKNINGAIINSVSVPLIHNSVDLDKVVIEDSGPMDENNVFIVDPQFVDPDNDNFHLLPNSLLIDAGTEEEFGSPNPGIPFFDLDKKPRVVLEAIDLGPYEYQGAVVGTPTDALPNSPINEDIAVTIGRPKDGDKVTGSLTVTGWALSPNGISSMALYVDGEFYSFIPQGGSRPDVKLTFPTYPEALESGFALTYPASQLAPGEHSFAIYAFDNQGQMNFKISTVTTDQFDNGWASKSEVSLDDATSRTEGNAVFIDNIKLKGVSHNVKMEWDQSTQQYSIIEIE